MLLVPSSQMALLRHTTRRYGHIDPHLDSQQTPYTPGPLWLLIVAHTSSDGRRWPDLWHGNWRHLYSQYHWQSWFSCILPDTDLQNLGLPYPYTRVVWSQYSRSYCMCGTFRLKHPSISISLETATECEENMQLYWCNVKNTYCMHSLVQIPPKTSWSCVGSKVVPGIEQPQSVV